MKDFNLILNQILKGNQNLFLKIRLKSIQVYDLSILSLSYSGTIFSGGSNSTFDKIYQVRKKSINHKLFGPTFPGILNENGNYILTYPG
jgi:hypothetical protein